MVVVALGEPAVPVVCWAPAETQAIARNVAAENASALGFMTVSPHATHLCVVAPNHCMFAQYRDAFKIGGVMSRIELPYYLKASGSGAPSYSSPVSTAALRVYASRFSRTC